MKKTLATLTLLASSVLPQTTTEAGIFGRRRARTTYSQPVQTQTHEAPKPDQLLKATPTGPTQAETEYSPETIKKVYAIQKDIETIKSTKNLTIRMIDLFAPKPQKSNYAKPNQHLTIPTQTKPKSFTLEEIHAMYQGLKAIEDSIDLTVVVPTAMTRPPLFLVSLIFPAQSSLISKY